MRRRLGAEMAAPRARDLATARKSPDGRSGTAIALGETSKEKYQPVVDDGPVMRVIGEVRCLHPGLAGIRARRVAEPAEGRGCQEHAEYETPRLPACP